MEDGTIESESLVRPRHLEVGDVEEREREKRQKVEEGISNGSSNKNGGGGILDNLLSKLSSPRTPKPIDIEVFDAGEDGGGGGEGGGGGGEGGGGGVFNNLISNFFHQNEGDEVEKDGEERKEKAVENEVVTTKGTEQETEGATDADANANGNGNGNIFTNLVPDNVSTGADEASILIHSVVHD